MRSHAQYNPRNVRRTGDNSAARTLMRYVWRMTEWHQVVVCCVAVLTACLSLIPIELQRRIVNEVVETQNTPLLVQFAIVYAAVIIVHQAVKYGLWIYQSWLSESAILYTRTHLLKLFAHRNTNASDGEGSTVAIVGAEVEKLGGFVGQALSAAFANAAILVGVVTYMFVVEPKIAVFALAFLIPQVLLTPVIQRHLNILLAERVEMVRSLGDRISGGASDLGSDATCLIDEIFSNRMRFFVLKFLLKSALNLLNALGPVTVLLFGGYLVMQGETQVGVIVAFLSGFERISSPLRELIAFYREAAQASVQHRMIAEWIQLRLSNA